MKEEIEKFFRGEIDDSEKTLRKYSRDASLFEVRPKLVVFPKDSEDLKNLVKWVSTEATHRVNLRGRHTSITVRAAGSCMSGGPLGESIVADVTRHMNKLISIDHTGLTCVVEPGAFYRDFELQTSKLGVELPCYPASKNLAAFGGMLGNNCAGEKTLKYGKMEDYVLETKVIFSDGNEYVVRPLNHAELTQKISRNDFEGNLYKRLYDLLQNNEQLIQEAKPNVSKNSAGYYLWNIWDVKHSVFDINKLLVGSQGTLGIITEAKLRLVPVKSHHDMVALFFKSWDELPRAINAILPFGPESLETFDEDTLKLGIRFMPEIARKAGSGLLSFAAKFLPEVLIGARMLGLPKLVVLAEIAEDSKEDVKEKVRSITAVIGPMENVWHRVIEKDSEEEKFWIMRRESFNLLRQQVGDKRTAPFVEDFCIPAEKVPEFLSKARKILEDENIDINIAGHAGNGNFHIIPLMELTKAGERAKITRVADKFYDLVAEYKGTITGEHNDGIVRTPYLGKMYSPEVLELFKKTKEIFDPNNIFNPGKKVNGTIEYLESHIAFDK